MGERVELAGGTIVITGAGSGVGAGTARVAAARGMSLVLADVAQERVETLARELRDAGARAIAVATDVRDAAAVDRLADAAFDEFGSVRVLFNNAGIAATGTTWEMAAEQWENVIRVNLLGVYHGIRSFVPRLLSQDGLSSIVNTASIASVSSGALQHSAYAASKHAVQSLTEALYLELEAEQAPISVHVVNPGPVATRIFTDAQATRDGARWRDFYDTYLNETGLTGEQVGEIVLAGVCNGAFWIETHPEMQEESVQERARMLLERRPPTALAIALDD